MGVLPSTCSVACRLVFASDSTYGHWAGQAGIGPGNYDVLNLDQKTPPSKPSPCFLSKTRRMTDTAPGNACKPASCSTVSTNVGPGTATSVSVHFLCQVFSGRRAWGMCKHITCGALKQTEGARVGIEWGAGAPQGVSSVYRKILITHIRTVMQE